MILRFTVLLVYVRKEILLWEREFSERFIQLYICSIAQPNGRKYRIAYLYSSPVNAEPTA